MALPESADQELTMGLEPSGPQSLELPFLFGHDSDPREDADLSAQDEIQACVSLLDRVWPRIAPPADQHPERLGRFKILGELGRGGFGIVFLAEDPDLGRKLCSRCHVSRYCHKPRPGGASSSRRRRRRGWTIPTSFPSWRRGRSGRSLTSPRCTWKDPAWRPG